MSNIDRVRDSWASLGAAFQLENNEYYNPEDAILLLIESKEFPEDKKMMGIALAWLKMYSKFVHVERLQKMVKELGPREMALLGAIASKCLSFNDHRWKKIVTMAKKKISKVHVEVEQDDEFLLKRKGADKEFLQFKIKVANIELESDKKFYQRERVFSHNPWLKCRLLFGSNLRADVATVIYLGLATTAYSAAKFLNSSTSAVYRNWQDLKEAKWDDLSHYHY